MEPVPRCEPSRLPTSPLADDIATAPSEPVYSYTAINHAASIPTFVCNNQASVYQIDNNSWLIGDVS